MNDKMRDYDLALALLLDLIEFGPWLNGLFRDSFKPWYDRSKVAGKDQDKIRDVVNLVDGLYYQMADDRKIEGLKLPVSMGVEGVHRNLKSHIDADLIDLLSNNADLQPLKSALDAVCMTYEALRSRDPACPERTMQAVIDIFDELLIVADRLGCPLKKILVNFPSLKEIPAKACAPIAEPTYEPVMLQIQSALPSPEQTQGMNRAALVDLLASPEAATALKALGYATVGPTLPLPTLRGLVEALRAAASMPQPVANRVPNLYFKVKILEGIDLEAAQVLSSIVSQLNARGDLYPDLCIEIQDPTLPELLLTWTARSAHNDGALTEVRLHVEAHSPERSHYEPPEPVCLILRDRAHKERLLCKVEIKDMILTAALLCRTVLGRQGFAISEVAAEPGTFAQLVKQSLQDTLRPDRSPGGAYAEGSDSEPTGHEPNVVKRIYGQILELKIKDLILAHSPFEWPNGFLVEWRGWVEHSGTPHYIQVTPDSGILGGPPGIHVNMIARPNGGPVQVGSIPCRPDLQDFLHAAATLYAGALDQLGVNRATIKAPPGTFAQDVSAATPLGPWDGAPKKDGFDPLDYPPF